MRMFVCLFKDFVVSCECNRHLKSLNLFIIYLAIRNIMLFRSVWGIERYLMILGATSADIEQVRRYRRKIIHQEVSEDLIGRTDIFSGASVAFVVYVIDIGGKYNIWNIGGIVNVRRCWRKIILKSSLYFCVRHETVFNKFMFLKC